jgi:hypothetical protein
MDQIEKLTVQRDLLLQLGATLHLTCRSLHIGLTLAMRGVDQQRALAAHAELAMADCAEILAEITSSRDAEWSSRTS